MIALPSIRAGVPTTQAGPVPPHSEVYEVPASVHVSPSAAQSSAWETPLLHRTAFVPSQESGSPGLHVPIAQAAAVALEMQCVAGTKPSPECAQEVSSSRPPPAHRARTSPTQVEPAVHCEVVDSVSPTQARA
ncbi:MAG: hypothetical protein JWO36_1772 [Myxococcales bacterium]|nr:hypothetical protein [Myxococcales bacterium]